MNTGRSTSQRRPTRAGAALALVGTAVLLASLAGCHTERRVVAVRGLNLADIPGAEGGVRAEGPRRSVGGTSWEAVLSRGAPPPPGRPIDDDPLRRELPDGSVHLVSRSPGQLLQHLLETLQRDEMDLLYDQLLSEYTKEYYRDRGEDPRERLDYIRDNAVAIRELLLSMPMADATPGASFVKQGRNSFRLEAPGAEWTGKKFTSISMRIENRRFVLEGIR